MRCMLCLHFLRMARFTFLFDDVNTWSGRIRDADFTRYGGYFWIGAIKKSTLIRIQSPIWETGDRLPRRQSRTVNVVAIIN